MRRLILAMALLLSACAPAGVDVAAPLPEAPDCPVLPDDSIWNTPIVDAPVHEQSAAWVASIGSDATIVTDFGSGTFAGGPIGIPYVVVDDDQPRVPVTFRFDDESDPGPYPVPPDAPIEGGPDADGDRHILVIDRDSCSLYELFDARSDDGGASWTAGSGAIFDLTSNDLRPETWTSADAAGLPILPGLVRYDEVEAGVIDHAIRMTAPRTDRSFIWPARHQAGAADDPSLPPMGARFRLDPTLDPAEFPEQVRPVLVALQTYGAILADNGSPWFIGGVPDQRWDNDALRSLRDIPGRAWQAVDVSGLQVAPDSGAARQPGEPTPSPTPTQTGPLRDGDRLAGPSRIETAIAISQEQFPDGAATAYLARADVFADAVAGGALTAGPILLVPSCGVLPGVVADEIARLHPDRVVALGGEAAVCQDLLDQARAS
ncbi:cell wall-binding repeat-containing protein [Euzebya tangerina]|uniref:cell wall-binding repeat-containing protein n=1 Tax=Euzebya tangerina TaxID=591198 RepID=UPI000E320D32|nr:cell wall-binding repeat-containing protein [Euzebya tangerina]